MPEQPPAVNTYRYYYFGGGALKQMWQSIVNVIGGFFGTDQNDIDETTGLSVYEKNLVRSSWEQAMKNKKKFSVDIFMRLFTQDPPSQDLFDQLRGIPLDELAANRKMKAHAFRVAASLNTLVEGLDDIEVLIEMLNNVARTHFSHQVTKQHYDLLGKVLMEAFEDELKDKFNQRTKDAWLKAYGVMEKVMLGEYIELAKTANKSIPDSDKHRGSSDVCKVTGLSTVEKDHIRKSWAALMKNKNENATLLIVNLFKMSEGAQDVFPKFKGKNPDELKKSIGVRSHGLRVLAALNSVVENLDDIECLVDMLQHIAHSHHPRGTSRKHFEDLGGVVIATFEEALGKKFTDDAKNAWAKAYGVILGVIKSEYENIEGNANEEKAEDAELAKEEAQTNGEVAKEAEAQKEGTEE
ncbi:uncharacterized protein [Apostichopus japonicus]|uniref:uncharacterized protein isoform X2 n=1 Tax=Stichopus japonicus TaxID=307972 RepID=UPI003AB3B910